jgi:hypothetical protein
MRSEVKWRIVAAICVALIYILVTAVFANAYTRFGKAEHAGPVQDRRGQPSGPGI